MKPWSGFVEGKLFDPAGQIDGVTATVSDELISVYYVMCD